MHNEYGLGDPHAQFKVYIANRPKFADLEQLIAVQALTKGEIAAICQACGNGWRKVFNVYAKLVFALIDKQISGAAGFHSWQEYRDQKLLQANSNTSLLFSALHDFAIKSHDTHIIMGKTYAKSLDLPNTLHWLDNEFAIDEVNHIIVCPYFDYRQLSNAKIIRLLELIQQLPLH